MWICNFLPPHRLIGMWPPRFLGYLTILNVGLLMSNSNYATGQSLDYLISDPEMSEALTDSRRAEQPRQTEIEATREVVLPEVALPEAEVISRCCVRQKKLLEVGHDLMGRMRYVDVGHCKHFCNPRSRQKKFRHINTTGRLISKEGTTLTRDEEACAGGYWCEATRMRQERLHLMSGPNDVEVISECGCLSRAPTCQRHSRPLLMFANSPYQTEVDVGVCRGRCEDRGLGCKPLRNRTVSVDGPNGAHCVQVIEECVCAGDCYRMQHRHYVTDKVWNATTNSSSDVMKEMDIGQCVGQCPYGQQGHCVLWDTKDPKTCLMSLTNRKLQCVPSGFQTQILDTEEGNIKTVIKVSQCGCA